MRRRRMAVLAAAVSLLATTASAMTVQEFLAEAADIPHNPTALLRADARRLTAEVRGAFATLKTEREAAKAAGLRPAFCPPENGRIQIEPGPLLARLNTIPPSRRSISVTQAMREWMAERYPCPPA